MISVKQLVLVQALHQHGSLSAVARALGYTQPAVSQQVRALEKQLGTVIVVRDRRGVQLTDAGRVLLEHSTTVMSSLSLAEAEVAAISGLHIGRVRVAAFPSAAATLVPDTMAELTKEHPGITFTMTQAEPPEALSLLRGGDCDIAVVFRYEDTDAAAQPVESVDLQWIRLLDERLHVVLPADHPYEHHESIDLSDLRDAQWIAGCPNCRGYLVKSCQQAGFEPNIAFETDDYVALQNLAARGLGVAILPDLVLEAVHVQGLHIKRLTHDASRRVSAVSTAGLARVPAVQKTLTMMQRAASAIERRRAVGPRPTRGAERQMSGPEA